MKKERLYAMLLDNRYLKQAQDYGLTIKTRTSQLATTTYYYTIGTRYDLIRYCVVNQINYICLYQVKNNEIDTRLYESVSLAKEVLNYIYNKPRKVVA